MSRGRHGVRSGWVGFGRYLVRSRSRLSWALKLEVARPCPRHSFSIFRRNSTRSDCLIVSVSQSLCYQCAFQPARGLALKNPLKMLSAARYTMLKLSA